jgi:hypothetical protein
MTATLTTYYDNIVSVTVIDFLDISSVGFFFLI